MKINHLKSSEIDFEAYDNCIIHSSQSRIYALSWFLNIVSPDWELLMADDYNFVMPIPIRKKYFFTKNAIQPSGCYQLGVFSIKELNAQIFNDFIDAIPVKKYALKFNPENRFQRPKIGICANLILDLNQSYENIRSKYKKERVRMIDAAKGIVYKKDNNIEPYWSFVAQNCNSSRDSHNLDKYELIFKEASKRNLLEVWIAINNKYELQATVCFTKWKSRIYYFFPASIQQQAMSGLLDRYIQANANSELILDFAASSSPIAARFIESFGTVFEPYPSLTKK